jgi:NADPH-dependent 2,4-dienoyl-CoA reductase/sulfur reductase-like enzyme
MTQLHDSASLALVRASHLIDEVGVPSNPPAARALATTGRDPRMHVVIIGGGFGGLTAARALRHLPVG